MAALDASGVTFNEIWKDGRTNSRYIKVLDVTLVLSSQGGLTNNIPAALFGLSKITGSRGFRDSSSVFVGTAPSFDGALLVFYTLETNGSPADKTATYRGIVEGLE